MYSRHFRPSATRFFTVLLLPEESAAPFDNILTKKEATSGNKVGQRVTKKAKGAHSDSAFFRPYVRSLTL